MINISTFKSGRYQKASSGYDYFIPNEINNKWKWEDPEINKLLEDAAIKLGELNSYARLVPNIDLFIQIHITKEAIISSKIEGTKTEMGEAFMDEQEISPERRDDWKEVINYIESLNSAIKRLNSLPISSRLLKETHKTLMDSVRGEDKLPGEFRTSQNWIGGNSISEATFIPPHKDLINDLMNDLEKFIHNDSINVPNLIKIAIIHYQFETIHPFLDGNGRIGRLLITLFLIDKSILSKPLLYLSSYFEKRRQQYYDNLTLVRTESSINNWIKYFLIGVSETSEKASNSLAKIIELKTSTEIKINTTLKRRSHTANLVLQELFKRPAITVNQAKEITGLTYKSANKLISDFMELGILKEISGHSRNRVFFFSDYLDEF